MDAHSSSLEQTWLEQRDSPLDQLYHQHAAMIFAYLRLHLPSREEAEDLLLEVFLAAQENPSLLEREEKVQHAWLRSVARHKMIDHHRKATHRRSIRLEDVAETLYEDEWLSPEQTAIQNEAYEQILAILQKLPKLQQQVIQLHFIYGLRSAEIASVLHKKESAVRKLLSRAVNLVRTIYLESREDI
jgi:RNA polymerase sigma factor (sigma-70 family)